MELTEILKTVETYARDYLRYLLHVADRGKFKQKVNEFDPKVVTFSLISLFIGNYIYQHNLGNHDTSQGEFTELILSTYSVWIVLSIILYFGVNLGAEVKIGFTPALTAILRVLPMAFVTAAAIGDLAEHAARFISGSDCASWQAFPVYVAAQVVIVIIFLPVSIGGIAQAGPRRTTLILLAVVLCMLLARGFTFATHIIDAAGQTYASLPKDPKARMSALAGISPDDQKAIIACQSRKDADCEAQATQQALVARDMRGVQACF